MSGAPPEAAADFMRNVMNINNRYLIPALASLALTATVALAQVPAAPGAQGHHRTPPTAEQMAARRAQFCTDMVARQAARFTFTETRLQLTAAQKPLFDRWKAAVEDNQASRQAACAKPRAAGPANRPTLPERNARMEEQLKTRLAALEKTSGPEDALYNSLTADQKKLIERGDHRGGMHRAGFRHGPMGRGQHGFQHPRFFRPGGAGPAPSGNPT